MDQFSSVIPYWKPHNVSILPGRGGGVGPPAPPPPTDAPVKTDLLKIKVFKMHPIMDEVGTNVSYSLGSK